MRGHGRRKGRLGSQSSCEKSTDVEDLAKADDVPELSQGWRAKDGSFHLKKADALSHNENLAAGPSLADQVAALSKSITDGVDTVEVAVGALESLDDEAIAKFTDEQRERLTKAVERAGVELKVAEPAAEEPKTGEDGEPVAKVDDPALAERLAKFDGIVEENDLLKNQVSSLKKQIDDTGPVLIDLQKKIDAILKTPMPGGPARTQVIAKGEDRGDGGLAKVNEAAAIEALTKLTPDQLADLAIKASFQNGTNISLG